MALLPDARDPNRMAAASFACTYEITQPAPAR